MAESTYSQRYASGDSNTAGAFAFDTISSKDYAVSKLAFGAVGAVTYVSASDPLPITAASLPLPSGAATSAKQDTQTTHLATIAGAVSGTEVQVDVVTMPTVTVQDGGGSITVDGTVGVSGTVAISAASLPLPSGAATAAKQPAIGTAGTASADVITVQGITSMTALKVDGSAVTQPVSGTVAATQSGAWNVTNVSGTISLPTGASTLVEQQSQTTHLATLAGIDYVVGADVASLAVVGNGTAATAQRVTIASDSTGTIAVTQGTATNLKAQAEAYQGGSAVGAANPLQVTLANGSVPSHAVTNAGTFAVQAAQTGTWTVTGAGGTFPVTDSGGTLTVDAPVGTPVFVRLSDGASAISTLPVSLASVPSHAVTNAGTFAVQVDGTALTRLTDIETNTDSGAVIGNGTAATAQRVTLANDSTGIVALTTSTASIGKLASNSGVTIGAVEIAAAQTLATVTTVSTVTTCSTVTTLTGGGVAHDGVDSGNPVKVGGRAIAGLSGATLVSAADRSDLLTGTDGALLVRGTPLEDIVSGVASITDGSSTSVIASQGAGVKVYVTDVTIANTSATAVTVDLRDGAAGSVKWTFPAPANTSGVTHRFGSPLPFSANTAVCADPSAAASTVTVSIGGFKSKV